MDQVRLQGQAADPPALVAGALRPKEHLAVGGVDDEGVAAVLRPDVPADAVDVLQAQPPARVRAGAFGLIVTTSICFNSGCLGWRKVGFLINMGGVRLVGHTHVRTYILRFFLRWCLLGCVSREGGGSQC